MTDVNPLDSLRTRIDSAKSVGSPDELIEGHFRFPPLELMGHLHRGQSAAVSQPLAGVYEKVASSYENLHPTAYQPPDDPMGALLERVRGREPQIQVQEEESEPAGEAEQPAQVTGLEAILGREVLALAGSSALSPDARKEAMKRVAIALENPSRENVRAILLALIQDG